MEKGRAVRFVPFVSWMCCLVRLAGVKPIRTEDEHLSRQSVIAALVERKSDIFSLASTIPKVLQYFPRSTRVLSQEYSSNLVKVLECFEHSTGNIAEYMKNSFL